MKSFKAFIVEIKAPKIGKDIGGAVYVHKDYAGSHPKIPQDALQNALKRLKELYPDHRHTIVKFQHTGTSKGSFSFIHSPDFDDVPEPISGDAIKINPDGSSSRTPQKKDPQIYHGKEEMVGLDYPGFDLEKAKKRRKDYTASINTIIKPEDPRIFSRIGTQSVWKNTLEKIKGTLED